MILLYQIWWLFEFVNKKPYITTLKTWISVQNNNLNFCVFVNSQWLFCSQKQVKKCRYLWFFFKIKRYFNWIKIVNWRKENIFYLESKSRNLKTKYWNLIKYLMVPVENMWLYKYKSTKFTENKIYLDYQTYIIV